MVESKERGKINILDVRIGEEIKCYNEKEKKNEFKKVKDIIHNGTKKVYQIKTISGKILECTLDHKIMTEGGKKTLQEIIEKKIKIKVEKTNI